jgi:hypothetical protein
VAARLGQGDRLEPLGAVGVQNAAGSGSAAGPRTPRGRVSQPQSFESHGRVVAACSVSGPLSALDLDRRTEELGGRIVEVAGQISRKLGRLEIVADRIGGRFD